MSECWSDAATVDFDYSPKESDVRRFWFRQEAGGACGPKLGVCVVQAECDKSTWGWGNVPPGPHEGTAAQTATLAPGKARAFGCDDNDACTKMEVRPGWVTHAGWNCE